MFALFNECELPHFSGLFFFQVVFISTPPGQAVPGDKTGKFHMELTLRISHREISGVPRGWLNPRTQDFWVP